VSAFGSPHFGSHHYASPHFGIVQDLLGNLGGGGQKPKVSRQRPLTYNEVRRDDDDVLRVIAAFLELDL